MHDNSWSWGMGWGMWGMWIIPLAVILLLVYFIRGKRKR